MKEGEKMIVPDLWTFVWISLLMTISFFLVIWIK